MQFEAVVEPIALLDNFWLDVDGRAIFNLPYNFPELLLACLGDGCKD
jgi:hypothetical protein